MIRIWNIRTNEEVMTFLEESTNNVLLAYQIVRLLYQTLILLFNLICVFQFLQFLILMAGFEVLAKSSFSGFFLNGVHLCYCHPVFFLLDSLKLYLIYNIMFMEQIG